jgi:hypothetical protein
MPNDPSPAVERVAKAIEAVNLAWHRVDRMLLETEVEEMARAAIAAMESAPVDESEEVARAVRWGRAWQRAYGVEFDARVAAEAREKRLRDALEQMLRLVSQARSKLFTQSACEHPALAAGEAAEDCTACAELLWGFDNGSSGIEPPDNLNSSLFDAERIARAALSEQETPR